MFTQSRRVEKKKHYQNNLCVLAPLREIYSRRVNESKRKALPQKPSRLSALARDLFTQSRRVEKKKLLPKKPLRLSALARDMFTQSRRVAKKKHYHKNLCVLAPLREIFSHKAAESQRIQNVINPTNKPFAS